MEIWTPRGPTCLILLVLLLPICYGLSSTSISTLCQKPGLKESIIEDNQCSIDHEYDFRRKFLPKRGVFEVNGTALERSLRLLSLQESMYAAVLVYARWCPFSRGLLPVFDSLSLSFPSIYHFTVEESALQRSALSYYGVNSFPVLFLHNKTAKVRYQGKRTYDAITEFYKEFSGLHPVSPQYKKGEKVVLLKTGEPQISTRLLEKGKLHDDVYLILSLIFLISRGLFYLLPRLSRVVKEYWFHKDMFLQTYQSLLHKIVFGNFQPKRVVQAVSKRLKGKSPKADFTQETGKALLSVPGWPSSSLAAVSLAEGSGSRHGVKGGDK